MFYTCYSSLEIVMHYPTSKLICRAALAQGACFLEGALPRHVIDTEL